MDLKLSINRSKKERHEMNAEDFIELAEYLKNNYIPKDECFEADLYTVLSSINRSLSDISKYLRKLSGDEKGTAETEVGIDIEL